jgi:hypothetical protein
MYALRGQWSHGALRGAETTKRQKERKEKRQEKGAFF